MKYFDVPEQNAAFLRHIDVLMYLLEKYGGNVVLPSEEELKERWENILQSIQQNEEMNSLTTKSAA